MEAQSCASVPPAPAWKVRMALLASYSPVSRVDRRVASTFSEKAAYSALSSSSMESSFSSMAISHRADRSSQAAHRRLKLSTLSLRFFRRFCTFWDFSTSFQKPSRSLAASSSSISFWAASSLSAPRSTSSAGFAALSFVLYSSNSSISAIPFLNNSSVFILYTKSVGL